MAFISWDLSLSSLVTICWPSLLNYVNGFRAILLCLARVRAYSKQFVGSTELFLTAPPLPLLHSLCILLLLLFIPLFKIYVTNAKQKSSFLVFCFIISRSFRGKIIQQLHRVLSGANIS